MKRKKEFGHKLFKEWVVKNAPEKFKKVIKERIQFWNRSPISNHQLAAYQSEYHMYSHLVDHGFIVDHTIVWGRTPGCEVSIIARTYLSPDDCNSEKFPGLQFIEVPQEELLGIDEDGPVPGHVVAITICGDTIYSRFFLAELEFIPIPLLAAALPANMEDTHYISLQIKNNELVIGIEKS